jgi:hypothetical protein
LQLQKPTAAVTAMAVRSVDARGFTTEFDVNENPNATALPLAAADYKLALAGADVLHGKAKPEGSVSAGDSRRVSLPVMLTYENLLAAEQAVVKTGGDVPYALEGGLSFDAGNSLFGTVRVPLRYGGTLKLREILNDPTAVMQNPAAQKLAKDLLGGMFGR